MKTSIKPDGKSVTLDAVDPATDEPIHREFYTSGRYVREAIDGAREDSQVCEMLAHRGQTLQACDTKELLGVVRTEWVRYREAVNRDQRRYA